MKYRIARRELNEIRKIIRKKVSAYRMRKKKTEINFIHFSQFFSFIRLFQFSLSNIAAYRTFASVIRPRAQNQSPQPHQTKQDKIT